MKRTIEAVYDGEVFRPREPVDLEPELMYRITVEPSPTSKRTGTPRSVRRALERAADLGVADLAEQHDHYLHGTPKR